MNVFGGSDFEVNIPTFFTDIFVPFLKPINTGCIHIQPLLPLFCIFWQLQKAAKCTGLFVFHLRPPFWSYPLVVPCIDNIFMVLLIAALAKNGATKPIFLDSGSPRGKGGLCVRAWTWFVIIV